MFSKFKRKERSILRRIVGTMSSFAIIGISGYAFFFGINVFTSLLIGLAVVSIVAPVLIAGGSFIELLIGIIEAFIEGLVGALEAIANMFNF